MTSLPGDEAAARLDRWFDTEEVLVLIHDEREAQHAQWGDQVLPMGTGGTEFARQSVVYRNMCEAALALGTVTYADILLEEVFEAMAESDPAKLKDELVQAGAVITKMIELLIRQEEEARG